MRELPVLEAREALRTIHYGAMSSGMLTKESADDAKREIRELERIAQGGQTAPERQRLPRSARLARLGMLGVRVQKVAPPAEGA